MPKVIKKKPVKKKSASEEEVKSAARDALEKIRARQKQVLIGAAGIAAVALIIVVAFLYSSSAANRARALELEAARYYSGEAGGENMSDEERLNKALDLYRKSYEAKASPTALYYLGNCYYQLKDYDKAIAQYKAAADRYSGNTILLPLVYQKLAAAYFKSDRSEEALNTLASLERFDNGTFRDTALILQARYYDRSGSSDKALEKYRTIASDFPFSPWASEAMSKLPAEQEAGEAPEPEEIGEAAQPADTTISGEMPAPAESKPQ